MTEPYKSEYPISVLLPVYNAEKYLDECISSILNQTFTDFEFIIINDGSTDSSKEIILSYSDKRIKYFENESNIKLIATLNKGFDLARGKYVARMDADDIAFPQRFELQYNYLENNPETGVCGSWAKNIGDGIDLNIEYKTHHDDIRTELYFKNYFYHDTVMIRSSVMRDNNIKVPNVLHAEDYALWILLSDYTRFHIIPEVLLKYRFHNENISVLNTDFQDKQSSMIRKSQYEKLGLNCDDDIYTSFDKWIVSNEISDKKQAEDVIVFLCSLYQSILTQTNIKKENLKDYFSKKTWALICEYPGLKSYQNIFKHHLIDKNISIYRRFKLLINCVKI